MSDSRETYDVAIIGAGPAGLFAATEIATARPDLRLAVIDKGPALAQRLDAESNGRRTGDWLTGFGGAGFFIGGRLAYDFTSLTGWPSHIDAAKASELVDAIDSRLARWGVTSGIISDAPPQLQQAVKVVAEAGLAWRTNFPARHLTREERSRCMMAIQDALEATHAEMKVNTGVAEIRRSGNAWELVLESAGTKQTIIAMAVIVAPGRAGAGWLASQAKMHGLTVSRQTSAGVRIETPSEVTAPFTSVSLDPRLFLQVPQGNFRTYAWVTGGYVTAVHEGDRSRISCRSGGNSRTGNTSFAILKETVEPIDPVPLGRARLVSLSPGSLDTPNGPQTFIPSLDIETRDIQNDLSPAFWGGLSDFLSRMRTLAPSLGSDPAMLYAPAIESTWTYGLDVDGFTGISGLYVAGDGAGVSQGAMGAAISGLVSGRAVAASL